MAVEKHIHELMANQFAYRVTTDGIIVMANAKIKRK